MSECPNAVFAWLVSSSIALTVAIATALIALGAGGVGALAATTIGALTACVFFLAELGRIPVSGLVLVTLALASAIAFLRTLWIYGRERRLLTALPLEPVTGGPLAELATAAGVPLYVTPARRPAAFCFGLARPRVALTSGLLERLDLDEQSAVVWHELEHARNREPLKCLLGRLAASTFFWIPALGDLLNRFLLVKEIAADRHAVARTSKAALAAALYEVASAPSVAAVGAGDFAAARVERLFAPHIPLSPLFRRRNLAASAVGATALALVFVYPAQLNLGEQTHLETMLTSLSLHGLPGMAAGLFVNGLVLAGSALLWRRLVTRRSG